MSIKTAEILKQTVEETEGKDGSSKQLTPESSGVFSYLGELERPYNIGIFVVSNHVDCREVPCERQVVEINDTNRLFFTQKNLDYPKVQKRHSSLVVDLLEFEKASIKAGNDPNCLHLFDINGNYMDQLSVADVALDHVNPGGTKKHTVFFEQTQEDGAVIQLPTPIDDIHSILMMPRSENV